MATFQGSTQEIGGVLSEFEVSLAVLFGSAARGEMHEESDLDIGVFVELDPDSREYEREMMFIITYLDRHFDRHVDVVDLRSADSEFVETVLDQGVVFHDPAGKSADLRRDTG